MNKVVILLVLTALLVAVGWFIAPMFSTERLPPPDLISTPDAAVAHTVPNDSTELPEVQAPDAGSSARQEIKDIPPAQPKNEEESALVGLEIDDASSSDLASMKVPEGMTGVLIRLVDPKSPAAEAQLEKGDVIVRAQREKVTSLESLKAAVGDRDHTVLTVYRGGYPFQVVIHKPFKPAE